ncbi:MAG: ATP-binding protein [bacterium]
MPKLNLPNFFGSKTGKSAEIASVSTPINKLADGSGSVKDVIAPEAIEVDFSDVKINDTYFRTLFVAGYPRFVNANWLSPLINFNHSLTISMFIYPIDGKGVIDDLRRKIAEMEAELQGDIQRGRIVNIDTQVKLEDARSLQEQLAKGAERFFQFGLYVTIRADKKDELDRVTSKVKSTLGSLMIVAKTATLQIEDGFKTTLPLGQDKLNINRNMDTTSLATTFPFTSSELTANEGIVYGINEHNDSLVVFDRFSLENANMVVFAKSGAGKSYMVKLEILRSLLFETEVIVIDPEDEYRKMVTAIGGSYIDFSFTSPARINPFDLPESKEPDANELSMKIISLHSLLKVMMIDISPQEDAILDRALVATYQMKGITRDPSTHKNEPPLMEDLYKILVGMEEDVARGLADRLEKYVKGSFQGIFSQRSNVDFHKTLTVFGIKNLQDELRPTAIFIILDYIWTKVKRDLRRRLLIVDEAWYLMKNEDSASFLYAVAKRARKYYLGLSTITQDVEDFLKSDYGKAIVTNSSLQILMKQSTSAVDRLKEVFYLSEGEKHLLLSAEVGESLFFAGQNHVAMRVVASPEEHELITTNPEELLQRQRAAALARPVLPVAVPVSLAPIAPVVATKVEAPPQPPAATQAVPSAVPLVAPVSAPANPQPPTNKVIFQVERSPEPAN